MQRMKKLTFAGTMCALGCLGVLVTLAVGEDGLWQTNFEAAKAKAKAEKKLMLVDFTGSDWCIFCKKLRSEILDKEAFKTEAPKMFVLVELDYPAQKELDKELKEQNAKLKTEYKIRGFPTVLMMDAEGQAIAKTGYRPGTPEDYVTNLRELVATYEAIVAMKGKLDKLKGLDRAKLLDEIVTGTDKLAVEDQSIAKYGDEIISLDPDNKAGLKLKYTFRNLLAEANRLKAERKLAEAAAAFDKAATLSGITGEQKQDVYFSQGECFFVQRDFAGIVACLKKACDAAPESDKAKQIKQMIERFAPMAEAQTALAKLKGELEKAEGLDRAKVLDQMIDAQTKLGPRLGTGEIEKWSKEIIALDGENKAGLKTKYELRDLLAEAARHLRAKDTEKAEAALAKTRALPGLTDAQKATIETLAKRLEKPKPADEAKEKAPAKAP